MTDDDRRSQEEAEALLDAWAAEQNEIAAHNLRQHTEALIEHARRLGVDWRAPGGLARAMEHLTEDAVHGVGPRAGREKATDARRGQRKVPDDVLRADVLELLQKHRKMSLTDARAWVAKKRGISTKTVERRTKDLRHPREFGQTAVDPRATHRDTS